MFGGHGLHCAAWGQQQLGAAQGGSCCAEVNNTLVGAVRTPRENGRVTAICARPVVKGSAGALLAEAGDDGRPHQSEVQGHGAPLEFLLQERPGGRSAGEELPLRS